MKLLFRLARKAPKWVVSGGILMIAFAILALWWMVRNHRSHAGAIASRVPLESFAFDEVVLCGNALVNYRTGHVLTKQWLDGYGDQRPHVAKVLPESRIVIVAGNAALFAFGFDGLQKPNLNLAGKPVGPVAHNATFDQIVFSKEGDLWKGQVDWASGEIQNATRFTEVGFFGGGECLRSDWYWVGDSLFLRLQGRTHCVSLSRGSVKPDQVDPQALQHGASPDGKFSVVGCGFGRFAVVDFGSGSAKPFPVAGSLQGVAWISSDRAVIWGGASQIQVYDRGKAAVSSEFRLNVQITALGPVSPGGSFLFLGTGTGPQILNLKSGALAPVPARVDSGTWISASEILYSTSTTDSDARGIWSVGAGGTPTRVSKRPAAVIVSDGQLTANPTSPRGALAIIDGDLWRYRDSKLEQLTHGQNLPPSISLLK